jgi:hypothetical protein
MSPYSEWSLGFQIRKGIVPAHARMWQNTPGAGGGGIGMETRFSP